MVMPSGVHRATEMSSVHPIAGMTSCCISLRIFVLSKVSIDLILCFKDSEI